MKKCFPLLYYKKKKQKKQKQNTWLMLHRQHVGNKREKRNIGSGCKI